MLPCSSIDAKEAVDEIKLSILLLLIYRSSHPPPKAIRFFHVRLVIATAIVSMTSLGESPVYWIKRV
jgi:hypothetical protein